MRYAAPGTVGRCEPGSDMSDILTHPFSIGLAIGLVAVVVVWFNGVFSRRGLARELKALREHLQRQMEITQKGNETQKKEIEELRRLNENLRVTNATLKSKPGRPEMETLVVYDKALHIMNGRAPGFGPAWENAVKEAEAEVAKTDSGIMPMLRKVFRPALGRTAAEPVKLTDGDARDDSASDAYPVQRRDDLAK